MESTHLRDCAGVLSLSAAALLFVGGCVGSHQSHLPSSALRDINAVLAEHDEELLAIPGVVGVHIGRLRDGKTLCLKVMLAREDSNLERRVPRSLEGHPIVTEMTGQIQPMK